LQTSLKKLSDCREFFEILVETVQEEKYVEGSVFYQCTLGDSYIGAQSLKLPDKDFITGISKIQNNEAHKMSSEEKYACKSLEEESSNISNDAYGSACTQKLTITEKIKLKKKMKLEKTYTGNYKNVDFVLGSAAEVERLWSVARYVITDLRIRLSPVMFEALLFLKVNKDYWDKYLVAEAMKLVTSAKYEENLKRLNEQEETTLNEEN
jgi:hypothetical protein